MRIKCVKQRDRRKEKSHWNYINIIILQWSALPMEINGWPQLHFLHLYAKHNHNHCSRLHHHTDVDFGLRFDNILTLSANNILTHLKYLEHRELRQGATSEWCRLGWSLIKLPGKLNEPDCAEHLWFRKVTHDLMVDPLFLWQTLFKDRVETFLGQHTSIFL